MYYDNSNLPIFHFSDSFSFKIYFLTENEVRIEKTAI